jgi:hypothetical protein
VENKKEKSLCHHLYLNSSGVGGYGVIPNSSGWFLFIVKDFLRKLFFAELSAKKSQMKFFESLFVLVLSGFDQSAFQ